ncbi:MAG: hypothetical protein Phog2KO_20500 [Phototrophicaceae bacterium]
MDVYMPEKRRIDVMVSSTTSDLGEHRRSLNDVITGLLMTPRMMDNDAATGKDGLSYSLDLVDEAEVYILLLGFRYGYVPEDPIRNPDELGMTHLEYRRAKERAAKGELCVFAFLLDDSLKPEIVRPKLTAFRNEVLGNQVKFFTGIDDLKLQVMQTLSIADCIQDLKETDGQDINFNPRKGEVLNGRYTFEEKLGQGGNGEVWKAQEHLPDGSTTNVAIKLLKTSVSDNPSRIERFKKEISVSRHLRHPHIILTTTDDMVGEQFYAVMDYIQGETLREFINGKQFSIEDTVRYLGQIAEALQAAHKQKVVHRDVKPENILVRDDKLYLGDFGLAVSPDEDMSVTATGELVGTKKYMSPEQWDNQATTAQTDIYALALIAYEMLTGEYPYDMSSHARLLTQHLNHELPEHPQLPDEVLAILRRATAKIPTARHATAIDFINALKHWQSDPDNTDTKISKYLDTLRIRLKGDVYEKLFVDMEGNIREVIQQIQADKPDNSYHDPMFSEFDDLVDEFMVELDAEHHQVQAVEARPVENILEQLLNSERVVLVGEPGSGKSFMLRRLVMRYIREYDKYQRVPVFVPLNAFKGETDFKSYVKQQLSTDLAPYYLELRLSNRLILICDALNEMPRTAQSDGRDLVHEVREELSEVVYFVVSCRIRDYNNDLNSLKLERLEVRDLDLPAIREFVRRYKLLLKYDDNDLWNKMGGSEALFTFWSELKHLGKARQFWQEDKNIPKYITDDAIQAWRHMWRGAKLIPLSRNPYLAQVICRLHGRDAMPTNRAELYQAFVIHLYNREQKHSQSRGQTYPEREILETFLTELASRMQAGQTTVLKLDTIANVDLLQATLDATILTLDDDGLRFSHQLLQEYFSAKTLALQLYADQSFNLDAWWEVNVWRESFFMLAEFVEDKVRAVRWLSQANPELAIETWQQVLGEVPIDNTTRDVIRDNALKKIETQVEPNYLGRASAGRALALVDDPRKGVGVKDGLPDIDWVHIPDDGEWTYQNKKNAGLGGYDISRYPVTCTQFQCFIDAPDGLHSEDNDWFAGLQEDSREYRLREQAFRYGNHPRESVNWYDAIAFCRWWSWKLETLTPNPSPSGRRAFDMMKPETWAVCLPTEFEWEKAARGTDGREYPYEGDFDSSKGNTRETDIGKTSAVGIFSEGASPYGVLDMSGNVWEWCLTEYGNPAENIYDENIFADRNRVLRGGSWNFNLRFASTTYDLYYPFGWYDYIGFRVVRRPSL